MTPRPSKLVYNDLNGEEIKHVVVLSVEQLLGTIPYLQRHLTLPRVRITIPIKFECYADQPTPEVLSIPFTLEVENSPVAESAQPISQDVSRVVDASPAGTPPDQVREEFGLAVPRPVAVRDGTGRVLALADLPTVDGKVVENPETGMVFDRTGTSGIMQHGTVVTLDSGQAGLAKGESNRVRYSYGNSHAGSAGKPAPPDFSRVRQGVDE